MTTQKRTHTAGWQKHGMAALAAWMLGMGAICLAETVEVPLTVPETAGIERTDEPVTSGVPLPKGAIQGVPELALLDKATGKAVPCQFTVLSTWADKSLKWVLLDFFASVPANGKKEYTLTNRGAKDPPGGIRPLQVKDGDAALEVNTGPLQFKVSKKRGSILDEVTANGTPVMTSQQKCESMMVLAGGYPAGTIECVPTDVKVECAGAYRTVIRSEGTFLNAQKKPIWGGTMTYVVRVTAYAGKPYVKVVFTLRDNAPFRTSKQGKWLRMDSWGVRFPVTAQASLGDWAMICSDGRYPVAPGKPVTFNQWLKYPSVDRIGWPSAKSDEEKQREALAATGPDGKRLVEKGEGFYYLVCEGDAFKAGGEKGKGWACLSRGKEPLVTVVVRDFWQNFPRGFSAEPGALNVCLLPDGSFWPRSEEQAKNNFYLMDGARNKSAEMLVWFGPVGPGADREYQRLDKPLYARAPTSWYVNAGAVWPLAGLVPRTGDAKTDEAIVRYEKLQKAKVHRDDGDPAGKVRIHDTWLNDVWGKVSIPSLREELPGVFYGYMNYGDLVWGFGYCSLHYDMTYGMLMQHLRFEDPTMFYEGDVMARHRYDIDHGHSGWQHYEKGYHGYRDRISRGRFRDGFNPHATHTWNRGLLLHWALTGDPQSLREATVNGAAFRRLLEGAKDKNPSREFRIYAWSLDGCLGMYEFTGDESYLKAALDGFVNSLLKMEVANGSCGHIIKDGKQSAQFTAYAIEPVIRLHHHTKERGVAEWLKRVLEYHRKKGTSGGEMHKGKYVPLRFGRPDEETGEDEEKEHESLAYNYQFSDGFAYLYQVYGKDDYLQYARKVFQDVMFYYGAQDHDVDPAFRTPLGYHFRGRVDNMLTKIHAFDARYDQVFLMTEEAAGKKK